MSYIINIPKNNAHVYNIAYIRALMIRNTIEKLDVGIKEKGEILKEVLKHLKDN